MAVPRYRQQLVRLRASNRGPSCPVIVETRAVCTFVPEQAENVQKSEDFLLVGKVSRNAVSIFMFHISIELAQLLKAHDIYEP